jgi:hypothetical protein
MSTAQTLIVDAMRLLGIVESGVTPSTDELNDGLTALNAMLDSFSNERLETYQIVQNSVALVAGTASYAIGAAQTIAVARPTNINSAFVRQTASNIDYALEIITREAYDRIVYKPVQSIPSQLFYDPGYPFGTIWLWPKPSAGLTLYFDTWQLFPTYVLSTTIALPQGYERMIKYNLACEIAPMFEIQPSQAIMLIAATSKANIKRMNAKNQDLRMGLPSELMRTKANIFSGP